MVFSKNIQNLQTADQPGRYASIDFNWESFVSITITMFNFNVLRKATLPKNATDRVKQHVPIFDA